MLEGIRAKMRETLGGEEIPAEWQEMHQQVIEGTHPRIPSYGRGSDSQLHYYGEIGGIQKGRMIIPVGEIEHSTHIKHINGIFEYVNEGEFVRTD